MTNIEKFRAGEIGFYEDIPFSEYAALKAVNSSTLKEMLVSPLHFKYLLDNPRKDTSSMRVGRAVHTAVLEPSEFSKQYIQEPKFDKRTTKGKEDSAKWNKQNTGKEVIESAEYDKCLAIRESVYRNSRAKQLLDVPAPNEISFIWRDKGTGVLCKGRLDRYVSIDNKPTVLDLKTTSRRATPKDFIKDILEYKYYFSAAHYLKGLSTLTGKEHTKFIIIAAESTAPYGVATYQLSNTWIANGFWQVEELLKTYKECLDNGVWRGYEENIVEIDAPSYAFPT